MQGISRLSRVDAAPVDPDGIGGRFITLPLVFSRKSLADVATESGFADQSHFTKEFRRFMNETPRAYRRRYQPK